MLTVTIWPSGINILTRFSEHIHCFRNKNCNFKFTHSLENKYPTEKINN
jgi:hypothetical protein